MKKFLSGRKKYLDDMDYTFTSFNGREYGVIINPDNTEYAEDEMPELELYLVWHDTDYCRRVKGNTEIEYKMIQGYYGYIEEELSEY
jgi:hypothetical protein